MRGRLVDTLPKHWGAGAAAGGAGDVAAALSEKLERHGALLRALGRDGLAALDPAAIRRGPVSSDSQNVCRRVQTAAWCLSATQLQSQTAVLRGAHAS